MGFFVTLVLLSANTNDVELKPPISVHPKEDTGRTSTYDNKPTFFHHRWQPSHKFKENMK